MLGTHSTCVARMPTISERISNGKSGRFGTWNLSGQCSKRPLGRQLQACCRWEGSVCLLAAHELEYAVVLLLVRLRFETEHHLWSWACGWGYVRGSAIL